MKKLKIFYDFDNVITNSSKAFLDCVYCLYKNDDNFKFPKWTEVENWGFDKVAPYLDKSRIEEIFESDMFYDNLSFFYDDNKFSSGDLFNMLANGEDCKLIIVSKGTKLNLDKKLEYIKNKLFIDRDSIILLEGTDMDKSSVDMTDSIQIDDNQDNLYSTNAKYKILFSFDEKVTKYNKKAIDDENIFKAYSIRELGEIISFIRVSELTKYNKLNGGK